jgi:hypothetical protein
VSVGGRPLAAILAVAVLTLLAVLPALWNGYPLVFPDTHGYLIGWRGAFPISPPYYAFAVWITSRPVSVPFTLLVQAAVTASVLYLFLRGVGRVRSPLAVAGWGALVLGATQLPWVASHIMPDVFLGVGFAALMLLFLAPRSLGTGAGLFVFAVAVFAAIVSTANVLVLCALAIGLVAARLAFPGRAEAGRPALARGMAYLGIVLALAVLPGKVAYDRWTVHAPSGAMLFSLLVNHGIAQDYLRRHCPEVPGDVCRFLPALKNVQEKEEFLWQGLAHEMGAIPDRDGRFTRLARRIMLARLGEVAPVILGQALGQLGTISLVHEEMSTLRDYGGDSEVARSIRAHLPGEQTAFAAALQQQGRIAAYYPGWYYVATTWLGYALVLALIPAALRASDRTALALLVAGIAFLLIGAAVQGGLVYPQPRYNAKVAWIAWLAAAAAAHRMFFPAREGEPRREPSAAP